LPISYAAKHLIRSWQLYIALLLGVVLAATFFAGVNIGADTVAEQALNQALANVPTDFVIRSYASMSVQNITTIINKITTVEDVAAAEAIIRTYLTIRLPAQDYPQGCTLVGILPNSHVYKGWTNAPSNIDENQTYIPTISSIAKTLKQGDTVQTNITQSVYRPELGNNTFITYPLNLTVAGFAELNSQAQLLVQGFYSSYNVIIFGGQGQMVNQYPLYFGDVLIFDLNKTLGKFLDLFSEQGQPYFSVDILVHASRDKVISVWDIPGSLNRIEALRRKIQNEARLTGWSFDVETTLGSVLANAYSMTSMMRLTFIAVSLPVFFVAWYMGATVSDVSFNLRRREIGLLSTKGFSKGQLFRMFLIEAITIGIVSGTIGLGLSLVLNPFFVRAVGGEIAGTPAVGIDVAIMTLMFSVVIVVLAILRPARKASSMPAVDALREYVFVEEAKPYRKRWPWIAFIIGTYKLIIMALGITLLFEVSKLAMAGANFLLVLLIGVWAVFDYYILTAIGPALFFWGFTKLFVSGSLKFQEVTARAARFLGDLGVLATKSVQRNPARAASVAFLIALIVGYGLQITGGLASDQDFIVRMGYANVGADIRIDLSPPVNVSATQDLIEQIQSNVPSVASTTVEYSFYGTSSFAVLQFAAINTTEWPSTAYYEESWFSSNDLETAFQQLSSNNHTVIIDRGVAESPNDLHIGDKISVSLFGYDRYGSETSTKELTIVGFYGVKRPEYTYGQPTTTSPPWSYVSVGLFHEWFSALVNSSTTRILVKLTSEADRTAVADQIRELMPSGGILHSAVELIQQQESNLMTTGTLSIQRLGVAFGILAASVGAALVSFICLKERQREASIMSVRGLSFRQLVLVLLTENLAVVIFAVLLGTLAGLIITYGTVASFNAMSGVIVSKRLVFPIDAVLTMLAYIGLVFASTIIPVVLMAKRYGSRLERVVRQA
jgi:ABC-type antimicrobial peptide transport system permease subunit